MDNFFLDAYNMVEEITNEVLLDTLKEEIEDTFLPDESIVLYDILTKNINKNFSVGTNIKTISDIINERFDKILSDEDEKNRIIFILLEDNSSRWLSNFSNEVKILIFSNYEDFIYE